jgi:hypothetical protein
MRVRKTPLSHMPSRRAKEQLCLRPRYVFQVKFAQVFVELR